MQSTSLFTYFRYANASPVCAGRYCVEGVLLHGVPEDEDPDHYHQEKEDAEVKNSRTRKEQTRRLKIKRRRPGEIGDRGGGGGNPIEEWEVASGPRHELAPGAIARIVPEEEEEEGLWGGGGGAGNTKAERTSLIGTRNEQPSLYLAAKKTRSSMMQEKPNVLDWKEEKEEEEDEPEEQDQDEVKEEEEEEAD